MKKLLTVAIFTFFSFSLLSARIITVDPYGGGDYERIHDAVTAAVAGDTVMCMSFEYLFSVADGGITVDKKLFIIGSGYDAVADGGCSIETLGTTPIFTFNGSAKASVLKGFRFKGNGTTVSIAVDNMVVEENFFVNKANAVNLSISSCKEDTIRSNIFTNVSSRIGEGVQITSTTDVFINNNLFAGMERGIRGHTNTNLIFANNVAVNNTNGVQNGWGTGWSDPGDNTTYYSNILMNNNYGIYNAKGTPTVNYNGFYNNGTNTNASGATNVITDDPLFVNYDTGDIFGPNSLEDDGFDFHLFSSSTDSSTYIDAGYITVAYRDVDGSLNDLGMYGGPWPFMDDFGIPTIPAVIDISVSPSTVSPGGDITIKATGRIGSGN